MEQQAFMKVEKPTTKFCPGCGEERPVSEFWVRRKSNDGLQHLCRKHMQESNNLSKYGVTPADMAAMRERQDGCCAVCDRPEEVCGTLEIDHDHDMPKGMISVRGLLCQDCNLAQGHLREDKHHIKKMYEYVAWWEDEKPRRLNEAA